MHLKNLIRLSSLIIIFFICLVKQTPLKKIINLLSDEVDNTSNVTFHFSQPKDTIAGACLAAHHFNNFHHSLLGHFQVHPLLVSPSDLVKGVPQLLEILLDPAVEVIGVTGVISDKIEEFYSPLITHFDERIPQKYANNYLPSLEDTANAVIKILQQLNWTKVTIIQSNDCKYEKVANHLKTAGNTTYDFIAINEHTIVQTIQKLKYGETKIFLILAPPHISSSIIHKAIEEGVVWPDYVWVVVLLEPATLALSPMWENVLLIMYKSPTLDYSNTTCTENVSSTSNFYSSLLYDAVWQVLMANKSLLISSLRFPSKSSNTKHEHQAKDSQLLLVLYIVRNKSLLELGHYNVTDSFTILLNIVDLPIDQLPIHSINSFRLLLVSLCIMIFVTCILAFVNFSLVVAFRKEKEVRAASFALTIVIYTASCLLIVSSTIAVLLLMLTIPNKTLRDFICSSLLCCFRTGLSVLLLTYILKTLRIWRIFSHFGKLSAAWSDSRLLVVVLIGSAVMLILSIVSASDLKYIIIRSFRNDTAPPYYEYIPTCLNNSTSRSHTLAILLAEEILVAYFVFLLIFLLILSLKTHNINRSNFKETKRTNIFIMVYVFSQCLLVILVTGDLARYAMFMYASFGVAVSFLSQLVIFPPTLYPIFYRHVKQ